MINNTRTIKIKSLYDLFVCTDEYITYLKNKNFKFDNEGYPIFKRDMFLDELPEMIVPYSQRNNKRVINKKKTVLCTFLFFTL